jgi:endonuclease/exonuclease/phosphatase family metal-dependent hydrolase
MKRLFVITIVALMFIGIFSALALAGGDMLKVWTQNLYIGADLTPVIAAQSPDEFFAAANETLEKIAANFFPLRAQRLATEIALYAPDLIALQEVEDISVDGMHPGPPFVDYLQSLRNALALRGQNYTVAAVVVNLDLEVPLPFDITGDMEPDTLQVVDRDVILVREGVTYNVINFGCTKSSANGCNYSVVAPLPSPLLSEGLFIERGYVGIDATVREKRVFFVTTHLEQRILSPDFPESAFIQPAQAEELVGVLDDLSNDNPGVPLILAGDFNSSPEDVKTDVIVPPYLQITGSGFTDAWTKNPLALLDPKGLTCCQDPELDNRTSKLYERIDIVFVRNSRFTPWEFVTTRVPIFPLWLAPNWGSDHGGVFARLNFR